MENKIIDNFINFLNKQNCNVPKDFLKNYFILTRNDYVSFSDCIYWINVERDNLVRTLNKTYKEGIDFFIISNNENKNLIKLNLNAINEKNNRRKYYKLTVDCFKKIAMSSNSKNGRLTKQYYIEMERIVKDFSNKELIRLQNENAILKRNLNPINISDKEGLYVWHENDILKYRIGSGEILNRRLKQHNSSHADNIVVDYCIETTCYKDLESIVLKILDNKRYRENKDFFNCDLKIIKKVIISVNKLLIQYRDNCDEEKILNIKNSSSKKSNSKKSSSKKSSSKKFNPKKASSK